MSNKLSPSPLLLPSPRCYRRKAGLSLTLSQKLSMKKLFKIPNFSGTSFSNSPHHCLQISMYRIPLVARTPLDLHRLFVEVTSRGGIDKVIREKKWGEVKGIFKFPSSATSASFVLRKYYLSLLYHFEQVYYFRKAEPSVSVADIDPTNTNVSVEHASAATNLKDGNVVVGTIDAKFEHGYAISVNVGSETLKGVLYHTPASPHQFQNV